VNKGDGFVKKKKNSIFEKLNIVKNLKKAVKSEGKKI